MTKATSNYTAAGVCKHMRRYAAAEKIQAQYGIRVFFGGGLYYLYRNEIIERVSSARQARRVAKRLVTIPLQPTPACSAPVLLRV